MKFDTEDPSLVSIVIINDTCFCIGTLEFARKNCVTNNSVEIGKSKTYIILRNKQTHTSIELG